MYSFGELNQVHLINLKLVSNAFPAFFPLNSWIPLVKRTKSKGFLISVPLNNGELIFFSINVDLKG